MSEEKKKSSINLDSNIAGALSYALGPVTGIVFYILEEKDKFVRFHALQSTITFGSLFVLRFILHALSYPFWGIMSLLLSAINLAGLVLWVILMVKAYQNEKYKLPVIGDLAEKNIK